MPGSPIMLFDSTTVLLRSIVDSLEGGNATEWDDHLEYGNQCIYELFQMSRPEHQKPASHVAPQFERASRAIPHVRLMNRAIRQKDRATAIKCGRAAVSEMNGAGQPVPLVAKPEIFVKPAARVVPNHRRKTAPKPAPAAKGKTARA